MSRPSTSTDPADTATSPEATRATVVLPAPFEPTSATASPGATANVTPNRARNAP
jgi:hypothetical protein